MKVKDYVPTWLMHKEATIKPSTYGNYSAIGYRVLIPSFGEMEIDDLTEDVMQQWVLSQCREGRLKRATIKARITGMCNFLLFAESRGVRRQQRQMNIRIPRVFIDEGGVERVKTLSDEDCDRLCAAVRREMGVMSVGMAVSLMAGLRIGEVCGLKWKDVDLEGGVIHVRRTVQRTYIANSLKGGYTKVVVGSPKSRTSRRDVPIAPALAAFLRKLRRPDDEETFFLSSAARPHEVRHYREFVCSFIDRHGLRWFHFHMLRHTFATKCIKAGVDAKTTSELLGHHKVDITLRLYVHSDEGMKRRAVERVFG